MDKKEQELQNWSWGVPMRKCRCCSVDHDEAAFDDGGWVCRFCVNTYFQNVGDLFPLNKKGDENGL